MSQRLLDEFASRDELERYLIETFAEHAPPDGRLSPIRGGIGPARQLLARIDPRAYAATRNHLDGAVTRLSPYIRHGLIGLDRVRDATLDRVRAPAAAVKLVAELGWRDFYQRVFARIGERIWDDLEPYKTGLAASDYADDLPEGVAAGATGLACMDSFARELRETGHLHNHARMWLAAWIVHWLRVRWQAGARWFLEHLLDGDLGSNNLSWQWVASTFSHKPYIFNRANLERYTGGRFCQTCLSADRCPFAASYPELARRLFPDPETAAARP